MGDFMLRADAQFVSCTGMPQLSPSTSLDTYYNSEELSAFHQNVQSNQSDCVSDPSMGRICTTAITNLLECGTSGKAISAGMLLCSLPPSKVHNIPKTRKKVRNDSTHRQWQPQLRNDYQQLYQQLVLAHRRAVDVKIHVFIQQGLYYRVNQQSR
jgi:hypothetical protein